MTRRWLIAAYADEHNLLASTTEARQRGYPIVDAYTPYPVHGLDEALGLPPSRLGRFCFLCGLVGVALALWFQHWTMAIDWPINVGGRPFNSWPAYVPVAFEVMVLLSGFGVVLAFLAVSRLYPGKSAQVVDPHVTDDRFVLVLEAGGPMLDTEEAREVLKAHGAIHIEEREETVPPPTSQRINLKTLNMALLVLLGLVWLLNSVLVHDPGQPNWEFMPEMVRGPAYRTYAHNPDLPNQAVMQPPPEGTIAREQPLPLHYAPTPQDAERAGRELANPYHPDDAGQRQRGARVFETHCQMCHDNGGTGKGPVTLRGVPPPPSLLAEKAVKLKDGQLFHILTFGQGNMPALAGQVSAEERWAVILHIRQLQKLAGGRP